MVATLSKSSVTPLALFTGAVKAAGTLGGSTKLGRKTYYEESIE